MFETVFRALNDRGVRYLVVGGVAVVLHGHVRYTHDLDLVVDLTPQHAAAAVEALTDVGLEPRAPVDARDFADPVARQAWIQDKGMIVFTLQHPENPLLVVDLFTEPPSDFEDLWADSEEVPLETTTVRIVSLEHLINMKRKAGRPRDMLDVEELEHIRRLKEEGL